ncbi:MAG: dynamin family protein [Pseudonocardiales bacterium]|nr:dynamin family protein [Pseudonocardiales bacterium]MBV9032522.1 dynamin family protein [Pseudonocardiales bacterium]MBW0009577.1 dynamin family protein [Pseudonocardiales bacterium]
MSSPTRATPSIGTAVRAVLRRAVEAYRDSPTTATRLRDQIDRLDEPLRVAVAGKVKAGKSTLLNALVGEQIAPTDAGECTRVITWYRDAPSPRVTLMPHRGAPRQLPLTRADGRLEFDLGGSAPDDVDRLLVDWPSHGLRTTTLIDTPGIASLSAHISARAIALLAPEDRPSDADAVIYLMRHLHATDVRFLESFYDQVGAPAAVVNTVAVLSRADEIGASRLDAMVSARQIARRYRTEPKVRRVCQTVVAVAGLLAQTARTLRQVEFSALCELAQTSRSELDALLLSADRFTAPQAHPTLPAQTRGALVERFGLFGLRLATTLIRQGHREPAGLTQELVRRSGLDELRTVLATQFTERRDVLKARSALLLVDRALREEPCSEAHQLAGEVERILAGAHEFRELRLLAELRAPDVALPPDARSDAERLLGGHGTPTPSRLGLEPDADRAALREAAIAALARWQRRAESPLSDRTASERARVVVRSCEGMLARLAQDQADS